MFCLPQSAEVEASKGASEGAWRMVQDDLESLLKVRRCSKWLRTALQNMHPLYYD
jgi:hypothetical protein